MKMKKLWSGERTSLAPPRSANVLLYLCIQSNRRDFITLMLEANEINPNVSEDKLTMEVDDEEDDSKVNKTPEGERILKGLTMEVIV